MPAFLFYVLTLALFVVGLMSKPMMVTLPFVLLLLGYWPLGRWAWAGSQGENISKSRSANAVSSLPSSHRLGSLLLEKVPFFLLSVVSSYVTFVFQRKGGAVSTSISVGARIANALVAYARYIGKLLWPQKLAVLYPHPGSWPAWQVAAAGGLFLVLCLWALILVRKRPYVAVGWFWFVGTLVPMIGLVQVGVQSMADRYTYVPIIGLLIALVWTGGDLVQAKIARQQGAKPGPLNFAGEETPISDTDSFLRMELKVVSLWVALVLIACIVLTSRQLQYWSNSLTLFSHAVQVTKGNFLAYNNLGFYLSHLGKPAEAMENYEKALEINPAYEDALNNMGYALAGQKKPLKAIPFYEAALRVRPNHVEVHNNLGNALADLGEVDKAIAQYRIVLAQQPDHVDAHNNLGIALAMRGQLDEGISHFQEAIRHKPNDASAHSNLGNALAAQHKFKDAIKEYEECLRIKPDDAQAHNNLGNVLAEQGLLTESIAHYQQALHLNADNPEAHCNLGMALAREGRRPEAVKHFAEALRLKPDYEQAKRQLESIASDDRK